MPDLGELARLETEASERAQLLAAHSVVSARAGAYCRVCGTAAPCLVRRVVDSHQAAVERVRELCDTTPAARRSADHWLQMTQRVEEERDQARAELAAERARHETTRAKVRAVEMLHCWTNEDGRRFVFADDLAVALQIPGALAASPSPVAGQDQPKEPTP